MNIDVWKILRSYKNSDGKCDDQQQYKAIIETSMVSTTDIFSGNSPIQPSQSMNMKNTSTRKPLHQFLETLEVKPKTDVRIFCAAKSAHKATRQGSILWSNIPKRRGYSKINQQVKEELFNWILQHPQVVVYPISNDLSNYPLTVKWNHSQFLNCYYRHMQENYIMER